MPVKVIAIDEQDRVKLSRRVALQITAIYVVLGGLWVHGHRLLLKLLFSASPPPPQPVTSVLVDWVFIPVTAVVLWVLIDREASGYAPTPV